MFANGSITSSCCRFTFVLLLLSFIHGSKQGYHERRLLNHLLDDYDPLERPVALESYALNVTFGLTMQQIIDVDEKNQILTTNAWLNLEWFDYNLQWEPSQYGGVKDLRITPKNIWRPDILMYNSADEKFDGTYQTNVVVRSNGTCLYVPPGIFKSTCKIDITWFPFDDQKCDMKFGSWTYDGFQLDLILKSEDGGDLSTFITNGEWHLIGIPVKKNRVVYDCCPEPYIDLTFTVQIRRRTLYYFFNLIVPCVLISSMALLGFTLPPDSGEKLTLGVTILLSLTVFLNLVAESMPTTSDAVPLIGTYFNCIMFMVASSVVLTVVVLNCHHRTSENYDMSPWIQAVFLNWLPRVLRMRRPNTRSSRAAEIVVKSASYKIEKSTSCGVRSSRSLMANVLNMEDDWLLHRSCFTNSLRRPLPPPGGAATANGGLYTTTLIEDDLQSIVREVKFITDQIRKAEHEKNIISDWKYAAIVVDRFCLIIFSLFTIIATAVVFLSAPRIIVQ